MQCPNDQTVLQMTERQGIEIDYCPTCRGVWLDRGELDKILVKERQMAGGDSDEDFFREVEGRRAPRPAPPTAPPHGAYREDHDYGHRKRRKRSFLEDLLDF
jgi:uncharacterized protein